uniref:Uncharacterized protein n=1 Tax=Oryza meridionalis TaxID=40149 RepID=A0A0E0EZD1_9ORYZ
MKAKAEAEAPLPAWLHSPQRRGGALGRARVPIDNEENDQPPPTPFALPSGPAPMPETLPLRLRCHPPKQDHMLKPF